MAFRPVILASVLSWAGCAVAGISADRPATLVSAADQQHIEAVEQARAAADRDRADPEAVAQVVAALANAFDAGVQLRVSDRPWMGWVFEAERALEAVIAEAPDELAAVMLRDLGRALWVASRADDAMEMLSRSMARHATYDAGLDLVTAQALAGQPHVQASPDVCARTRPLAGDDDAIVALLRACYAASPHAGDVRAKLPWASDSDVAAFDAHIAATRPDAEDGTPLGDLPPPPSSG